jgi:hypothetical protein
MIYYLVTRDQGRGITRYLESRGKPLGGSLRILFFDDLHRARNLTEGTYIFSNLDHLSPAQREVAGRVGRNLLRNGPGMKIFNRPDRVLLRTDLLHTLHALGVNRFRAIRASDPPVSLRFPVFLRAENNHLGALTGLLHAPKDIERAINEKIILGYRRSELLVVEFCDTSDAAGIFRKYSAFKIGERILPRYLNFSPHWVVKFEACRKENEPEVLEYLERNPHEAMLRKIFEIAGVDYGRIDYGILHGRPQVWEINLNPLFGRGRSQPESGTFQGGPRGKLEEAKEIFHARFLEALRELDGGGSSGRETVLNIPVRTLRTLKTTLRKGIRTQFRAFMNMKRKPWVYVRRSLDAAASMTAFLARMFIGSGFRR